MKGLPIWIIDIRKKTEDDTSPSPYHLMPIKSGIRTRVISSSTRGIRNDTIPGTKSTTEGDTHADTGVGGANMALIALTGEVCDVSPFSDRYEATPNVPLATCATVVTHPETGEERLLIFHQMLWFGTDMPVSLIQPNQLRANGIKVYDDPTDTDRPPGIQVDKDFFLPFSAKGPTMLFESRCPTGDEMQHLKKHYMTADFWDPFAIMFPEMPQYTEDREHRNVVSLVSSDKPPDYTFDDEDHEYDLALGQICDTVYDEQAFARAAIATVNVACTQRSDVDAAMDENERLYGLKQLSLEEQACLCEKDRVKIATVVGEKQRHGKHNAETIARKWSIGLEQAKATLKATTQLWGRTSVFPMTKRYRADHLLFGFHKRRIPITVYMDQMFSKIKSLAQNTGANVITDGHYTQVDPFRKPDGESVGNSLWNFVNLVGIPVKLIADLARVQEGYYTKFIEAARKLRIMLHWAEKGRHTQNWRAEAEIGTLKRKWNSLMKRKKIPKRLWDFGLQWIAEIMSRTARGVDGRTGYEIVTGETPDISCWLDFEFFDLVWFWKDAKADQSDDRKQFGYWLGVAQDVGTVMTYWILTVSGKIVARTTVQHVTKSELLDPAIKSQAEEFDKAVRERLDDENHSVSHTGIIDFATDEWLRDVGADVNDQRTPPESEYDAQWTGKDGPDKDDDEIAEDVDGYDEYINAEVSLWNEGELKRGRVVKRARDKSGNFIGKRNPTGSFNPELGTREYEIEFSDGSSDRLLENVIARNLFSQIDSEGRSMMIFKEIVDHSTDGRAVAKEDGWITRPSGTRTRKATTAGWKLLVEFNDGATEWMDLKLVKDSNPIELAEYAVANRIDDEPAFAWWVPHVLRKRNRIISKVKKKYWRTSHKYGIRLPKSVLDAIAIDKETGTDYWQKAIAKEMKKVMVAFEEIEGYTPQEIRDGKCPALKGFQETGTSWVFDVKMDFTRKARLVCRGDQATEVDPSTTYSSVVSRDSVRIAFLIAGLNDVDIMACDCANAYLNAPARERIWTVAGPEFPAELQGKALKIVRALYGQRSAGASWRKLLSQTLVNEFGFRNSQADQDVWIRPATKKDGSTYYEMILVYVDDLLCVSENAEKILRQIGEFFELKNDEVAPPTRYLGADVGKVQVKGGIEVWAYSAESYVKAAVHNVEEMLRSDGPNVGLDESKKRTQDAMDPNYRPELDVSDVLGDELHSRYMQLIGVLRWAVELGRIDIATEVSLLSQHNALPRKGHLDAVYQVFAYLKRNPAVCIAFDHREVEVDTKPFKMDAKWDGYYEDAVEVLPPNMPEPRGKQLIIHCFVDSDHAGNKVTRRSHTGILIFLNCAPIIWYSKRQNTVESSTFGSEFVALRIAVEQIKALRYKLRMFGVPVGGPALVYCDNQGVVKNAQLPESTLSKKHNAVNYHLVREAAAAGIIRVGKEDTKTNLADPLTKILPRVEKEYKMNFILRKARVRNVAKEEHLRRVEASRRVKEPSPKRVKWKK